MLKEWPLVAFTILGQAAVGVFWTFHLPFVVRGRLPAYSWRLCWLAILGVVLLLMAAATGLSFFHLRHPLRARRALGNLRTSWLSREILFELVFMGLVAVLTWQGGLHNPERWLQWMLLAAAGSAGGLFLYSMARLYMLPALPAWSGAYTPLAFLLTALTAGAITTEIVVRSVVGPGVLDPDLMPVALALLVLEIAVTALAAPGQGLRRVRPAPSLRPVGDASVFWHRARIVLLAAAAAFVALEIGSGANDIMAESGADLLLLVAFFSWLAGETAGRFHFYGLAPRPGD